jgi:hypothetical protein
MRTLILLGETRRATEAFVRALETIGLSVQLVDRG